MNLRELKEIFRLVEKTDFTEVELVQGDFRLRVERGKGGAVMPIMMSPAALPPAVPLTSAAEPTHSGEAAESVKETKPALKDGQKEYIVTSPFVGTFYRKPSPDADSYVEVGQRVRQGQILCIVEAMKLMNELESDYDGVIAEVYAENGTPVEFGEKLFRILSGS